MCTLHTCSPCTLKGEGCGDETTTDTKTSHYDVDTHGISDYEMYTAIHCSKCLFVHQCTHPQCLAIIATLLSLQLTAVVVAQTRAVEEVWGDRGQWRFHGHPVCSHSMQLVGNVRFYGDSIVLKWVLICVFHLCLC